MEDNKVAPSAPPQGGGASRRPLGVLVVFHWVRISYVLASFPEPFLVRFSTKFADSENSLPQGAFLKSLPEASYSQPSADFPADFPPGGVSVLKKNIIFCVFPGFRAKYSVTEVQSTHF